MFEKKSGMTRRDFLRMSGLAVAGVGGAAVLAGCSSSGSSSSSSSASSSDSGEKIKIGCSIWSSTDALGSLSKKIVDQAADILGVETSWVDQGHVSEQVTASVETLCAAGCQGIIICNSADSEMTSCINTCNSNQVYLTQFYRIINKDNSPDVYSLAQKSKYYVGAVHENEIDNGETLVNLLLQGGGPNKTGARNIKLEGWTVGDATFQQRWTGYKNAISDWNSKNSGDQAKLSDPVYANTSSAEGANVTQQFYNTDPAMDALIVAGGGGDPLVGSIGQLANMGLTGKISVVSTDFLSDLEDQLKSGGIFAESGGHFCDPLYSFLMVYNAVKGNYAKADGDFGYEIKFPYIYISSSDQYADYKTYFVDQQPYTDDEINDLAGKTFDELNTSAESLSIDDVKQRHSK